MAEAASDEVPQLARKVLRSSVMAFDSHTVAERGRKIYERYRLRLETDHRDQFVAIDTHAEKLFLGESLEAAYRAAREARMEGPFHFVHIGHRGVYSTTRSPGRRRAAGE